VAVVTGVPGYVPPVTRATFRRSLYGAIGIVVIALAVLIPLGHVLAAVFLCVGVALGLLNTAFAMQSVMRFSRSEATPSKAKFSGSVLVRLAVITVIAVGCAYLFRPSGIAVFGGLALFQLLATVSSTLPLIKEIRRK
jgi:hypothetical protein